MRRLPLLLAVGTSLVLAGCGFEEPPSVAGPTPLPSGPVVPPAQVADPCTAVALSLLDGQLGGLPSADPAATDKGGRVADAFQARYDAVIASTGVEAARAQYTDEISAACAG